MRRNKREKNKEGEAYVSLSTRLAKQILPVLVVCFLILILVIGAISFSSMRQSVQRELNTMAEGNASRIQSALDESLLVSENMQSYLVREYDRGATMDPAEKNKNSAKSLVTGDIINGLNVEVEQYLIKTSWDAINNSDNIMGMGANFEPNKFDSKIRSYAYYINEDNAKQEISPFLGEYEEYCNEIYYQRAKEDKQPYFTEAYEFDGIKRIICSFPIVYQDEYQGNITVNIRLDRFSELVKINSEFSSMYSCILTQDGTVVYDSDGEEGVGKSVFDYVTADNKETITAGMATGESFTCKVLDEGSSARFFMFPISAGSNTWWAMTSVEQTDMDSEVLGTVGIMFVLVILIMLSVIFLLVRFLKRSMKPLADVAEAAEEIMEGKLEVRLTAENNDEIGRLINAFDNMADNLKDVIDETAFCLGEMATGNFLVTTTKPQAFIGEYRTILEAAGHIKERLSEALSEINRSSEQVANGSEQVASASQALSEGAADQAASVEELAASINDISEHVKANAENAQEASHKMQVVGLHAQDSTHKMDDMLRAISDISEKSKEIENIIRTIEELASQTNLLSLNAAIEAARAGEAGKGFAVVAEEVRELAARSAQASRDTSDLIQATLASVEHGTKIADETAKALTEVVGEVEEITGAMQSISNASEEQASAINEITQGVDQISGVVQNNSATAQESAAASEELSGLSQILKELVSRFRY